MAFNLLLLPTVALGLSLFVAGIKLEKWSTARSGRNAMWLLAITCALPGLLYATFYLHLFDDAAWFYELRTATHSELAASGVGLLAGMLYSKLEPEGFGERAFALLAFLTVLMIPHAKPMLAPLNYAQMRDACTGPVCLQSTPSTCGPASAATLLRYLGFPASERGLAQESFTYRGGTESWYLARAIARRGLHTAFMLHNDSSRSMPTPSIAGVRLRGNTGHFIAILDQTQSHVTFVDPLVGLATLEKARMTEKYRFTGFFLQVSRPGSGSAPPLR